MPLKARLLLTARIWRQVLPVTLQVPTGLLFFIVGRKTLMALQSM